MREALQASCSDYLYVVDEEEDWWPLGKGSYGYTYPTFLVEVIGEARRSGLVLYAFLNGPTVPIYARRERLREALEKLEEERRVECNSRGLRGVGDAIVCLYKWFFETMKKCGFREAGFAYSRSREGEYVVLVLNSKVYTRGTKPSMWLSANAVSAYRGRGVAEAVKWAYKIMRDECGAARYPGWLLKWFSSHQ
ncbi:MAG: hypothetical protein GXO09_01860 [Crenarchaeota archaeon]|nr:hypothetical protein [Thermoproteota archaeon]